MKLSIEQYEDREDVKRLIVQPSDDEGVFVIHHDAWSGALHGNTAIKRIGCSGLSETVLQGVIDQEITEEDIFITDPEDHVIRLHPDFVATVVENEGKRPGLAAEIDAGTPRVIWRSINGFQEFQLAS